MQKLPFDVRMELEGWALFWAEVELADGAEEELAALRRSVVESARERLQLESLSTNPVVKAVRHLFRAAGCDPTRYRPSSEALLRRILKGEELPAIHPLVDLSNTLSAELAVPCCAMSEGTFHPPFLFRAGRPGEGYESLRGPFRLEGKPLLCDAHGPLDCPITGNDKVKVTATTRGAWLVVYLPAEAVSPETAGGSRGAGASGTARPDPTHRCELRGQIRRVAGGRLVYP
jgi:DNA/RNA-binding domain of Phe-tRNA-synthetase-like protein